MHEIPSGGPDANNLATDYDKNATLRYSYSSSYYYPRCEVLLRVQVIYRPEGFNAACTADFRFDNFIQGKVTWKEYQPVDPDTVSQISVTPGRPSVEVRSAGPHSLLLSIRRNESMECFDTPFEMVNRLAFVSQWDYQTVSKDFCPKTTKLT